MKPNHTREKESFSTTRRGAQQNVLYRIISGRHKRRKGMNGQMMESAADLPKKTASSLLSYCLIVTVRE
jgi:hypothetical protein